MFAVDGFFLVDIFVNFSSAASLDDIEIEEDRKKIALMYMKSWFLIDLLSIMPFDILYSLTSESLAQESEKPQQKVN